LSIDLRCDHGELGAHLAERNPVALTADQEEPQEFIVLIADVVGGEQATRVEWREVPELERALVCALGCDADNSEQPPIQLDGAPDDIGVC